MRFLLIRFLTVYTPQSDQKARNQIFKLDRTLLMQLGHRRQLRRPNPVSQPSTGSNTHRPRNALQLLIGSNCQPNILLDHGVFVHVVYNAAICIVIVGIKSGATAAINLGTLRRIVEQL
jgi:hypothetical protein